MDKPRRAKPPRSRNTVAASGDVKKRAAKPIAQRARTKVKTKGAGATKVKGKGARRRTGAPARDHQKDGAAPELAPRKPRSKPSAQDHAVAPAAVAGVEGQDASVCNTDSGDFSVEFNIIIPERRPEDDIVGVASADELHDRFELELAAEASAFDGLGAPDDEEFSTGDRAEASDSGAIAVPPEAPARRSLDYLDRARKAAQAQAQAETARRFAFFPFVRPVALGLAASITAPALVSAVLIFDINGQAPTARAEARAAVAPPTSAAHVNQAAVQYAAALRLFGVGDVTRGLVPLRASADGGFPMAQYRLAKFYERGEGVPRDLTLARIWTERAASAGNCRAMHDVGVFFARGEGTLLDATAAFRWFRAAASCGVADSQYNLGILYRQGRGVDADPRQALFWFLVAAYSSRHNDSGAFEQALDLATQLTPIEVQEVRAQARAFQARAPDPLANGALGATAN